MWVCISYHVMLFIEYPRPSQDFRSGLPYPHLFKQMEEWTRQTIKMMLLPAIFHHVCNQKSLQETWETISCFLDMFHIKCSTSLHIPQINYYLVWPMSSSCDILCINSFFRDLLWLFNNGLGVKISTREHQKNSFQLFYFGLVFY